MLAFSLKALADRRLSNFVVEERLQTREFDLFPLFQLGTYRSLAGRLEHCTEYIMQGTPLTLFVHLTHSYGCASSAHAGEHRYTLAAEPRTLNKLDAELWGRRTRETLLRGN